MNEKVLLIIAGNIGDVLRATPVLRILSDSFNYDVDVLTSVAARFIFENNPCCRKIYLDKKYKRAVRKIAHFFMRKKLKDNVYSKIYIINKDIKFAKLARAISHKNTEIIGFNTNSDLASYYDCAVMPKVSVNTIDAFCALLENKYESRNETDKQMELFIAEKAYKSIEGLANAVILHFETTEKKPYRGYNLEQFRQIVRHLQDKNYKIIITATKKQKKTVDEFIAGLKNDHEVQAFVGRSIQELCALIDKAHMVICPDTGVFHIARALKTPVLGIYGPTDCRFAGAIGEGIYEHIEFGCDRCPCFDEDENYDWYSEDCLKADYAPCLANLDENTIIDTILLIEERIKNGE